MAGKKNPTPSERAEKAEAGRKALQTRIKNLQEAAEKTKAAGAAALRKAKAVMANQGVQQLAASTAGGALAGASTALLHKYSSGLGETVGGWMEDDRIAGAVVGVVGGVGAVLADKSKGKARKPMLDVACGFAAGGAAIATRKITEDLLPTAGLRVEDRRYGRDPIANRRFPRQVQGLRIGYEPANREAPFRPAQQNAYR